MTVAPEPGLYFPGQPNLPHGVDAPKALFLDRDGVINVNHGYVCTPHRTDWVPGIFELCAMARDAGYVLLVVTNQAGIARGYYSEADFLEYTRWMHREFSTRGADILATIYCPHHPTAGVGPLTLKCDCRKPAPGMFTLAGDVFGLDMDRSIVVGDKESDLVAAAGAGVARGFLIDPSSPSRFDEVTRYLTA